MEKPRGSSSPRHTSLVRRAIRVKTRLIFFLLLTTATIADGSYGTERPNALALNLGGRGLLYSLTYDRIVAEWVGIGGGLMVLSKETFALPFYLNFYPNSGIEIIVSIDDR